MNNIEQQYILTQDTNSLFELLGPTEELEPAMGGYLSALGSIVEQAFSREQQLAVRAFTENEINQQLSEVIISELIEDPECAIICADRFLLGNIESQFPERFGRLSITRRNDGVKSQRAGNLSLDEQVESLAKRFADKNIILVDDGIFSGGTMKEIVGRFEDANMQPSQIKKIFGYIGSEASFSVEGIPTEILNPIDNLFEWIDIRDFGPWGGKQSELCPDQNTAYAIPYIYPWSDGSGASFNRLGSFFSVSKQMISSYTRLIETWEEVMQRQLTFTDFINAGISLPNTAQAELRPNKGETVLSYLDRCMEQVEVEENRNVVVFDMDGTLYELGGPQNRYAGSVLEQKVNTNAVAFICQRDGCDYEQAERIFKAGLQDPIGLSSFLSKRYSISRNEYFDEVWNINPDGVIQNDGEIRKTIQEVAQNNKCILVTGAAKVWQQNVLQYLNLGDLFELIYTGEDFDSKAEIFEMLSQRYAPKNIVSVGDQWNSDIEPAQRFGLQTMYVNGPQQVNQLLAGVTL